MFILECRVNANVRRNGDSFGAGIFGVPPECQCSIHRRATRAADTETDAGDLVPDASQRHAQSALQEHISAYV